MDDDTIRITHFINPHMFWYKPVSAYVHNLDEKRFQLAIDEYCEQNFGQSSAGDVCDAFPGETVAVLDFDRNKWCRCIVDEVAEDSSGEKRYNLWSIDDGVPIKSFSRYVNPLPEKFARQTNKVRRGAIKNILPSEYVYDNQLDRLVPKICSRWDPNAAEVLQSVLRNSATVHFRKVTRHSVHNIMVNFGDLELVTNKNNVFNAAHLLKEIRKGFEVEPSDFITRLSEIQTMSGSRSLTRDEKEIISKANQIQSMTTRPVKPSSQFDQNRYTKVSNGIPESVRDHDDNGLEDDYDFNESASMVKPNNIPMVPRKPAPEPISEGSHSGEEQYPLMSPMNKSGMKIKYEMELWKQNGQPKSQPPTENMKMAVPKENHKSDDRTNGTSSAHNSRNEESLDKPKSAVSFLAKLEMRKKQRAAAAQKQTIPEQTEEKSSYADINIIPAGYQMGNLKFENGKVIAGEKPDTADNRKSSWATSRPRNLRKEANGPHQQQQQQSDEYDTDNCKVYVTKNGSRFDQVIEDEACIRSRLCHQRLLVHGNRIPKPVESLESANFCPEVHRELSILSFRSIHRIQTYAWPHILRGNSFFCVNSAATGKTFTYLPAICSSVKKMHDEDLAVEGAGPFAIIICKSSREVQRVARHCRKMLNSAVNVSMAVVEAFGARDIPKACNLLLNGCVILVATAPGLRRIHENMPNAISKERVQSIVIDNIDNIIERFGSELQLLCKICDKPELQMVITTTYWSPMFFGFLKRYKNMIMCIGAYLEAAMYGKSDLVLQLNTNSAKVSEVVKFIHRNRYQNERTMVICSEAAEVYELVEILKSQSITHMYCNDTSTLTQMNGFKEWDNQSAGEMHVMICSDAVIPDLEISRAQHIIHFSLPSSWTMFTRRFACSFGYYRDPFHVDEKESRKPASSLVLLDENNNEQLPKLVEFLKIHNHEVAEPIVKLANNIRIQQEEQKLAEGNHVDFCSQVLEFGKCRTAGCMKRHLFTTRDLSFGDLVPTSGIIKLKIYNMFSPTHYTARVLEHRSYGAKDWKAVNDAQDFFALDIAIQQHYSNEERHHDHGTVHYNDWCVIYDEFRYWRCRIVSIEHKKELSVSRKVKVKLLDVGRTIDCVSSELLHMPEEFRRLPPQAIDIRIVGVVPHDFELEWDKVVTLNIREWIHRYTSNDNFHVEGKVLLAIKDTIWVDTVRLVQHLDGIKTEIMEIHLKSEIVGKNFGVADKEPLELLSQMVENCQAYQERANKATSHVEESLSDVEDVNIPNRNNVFDSREDFQQAANVIEIDKSVKPKILKPIELNESDSDDCVPDANVPDVSDSEVNMPTSVKEELQLVKPKVQSFNELYDEFDEESTYEVYISQYYAPDDFYVCIVEKFTFISSMINNLTEDETNLVPLEIVDVGDYCLVLYDSNYQRAKVTHIEGRDILLFFLDLGGYETYGQIDLFKLPDELLKAAPFCAIKAEVACLKPRENEDHCWSPEVGDRIYDEVLCHYRSFNAKVIETLRNAHVESLVKCKSYRLLLFSPEQELESWIFDDIVELKLARYIEEERPFALDINFGDDDYRQIFNPNSKQKSSTLQDDNEARFEEIVESNEIVEPDQETKPVNSSKLALIKKRLRRKKSVTNVAYPRLKCDFRSPKTIWRQDEYLIVIRAVAPENVQYDLTVDSDSLKLCYISDDEKYLLSVVFFAAVVPKLTIHEVRGLSIVVRLPKLVQTIQWPSLMRNGDKVPWLQQCIEVSNSDETDGTDGMRNTSPAVPNLESTDSLSEETDYDDQFDRFDPMADDYFLKD